jgi:hypothetical protein
MTGLVRKASLLAVLGLLATAAVAGAGIPDPTQSVVPDYIDLVTCSSGVPDPYGAFTVTVNDAAGNPVAGCEVKVAFNTDLFVYDAIPGLTVECGLAPVKDVVIATSGVDGVANFTITGASINTNGVATGSGIVGATVYACEVNLGDVTVACYDENGAVSLKGMEGTDLAAWLGDMGKQGTIGYKGRSDFDHIYPVSGTDLSYWLKRFGAGYPASCGNLCAQ